MKDGIETKEIDEPYTKFKARAEFRLWLGQDNTELSLTQKGYDLGLIDNEYFEKKIYQYSLDSYILHSKTL